MNDEIIRRFKESLPPVATLMHLVRYALEGRDAIIDDRSDPNVVHVWIDTEYHDYIIERFEQVRPMGVLMQLHDMKEVLK